MNKILALIAMLAAFSIVDISAASPNLNPAPHTHVMPTRPLPLGALSGPLTYHGGSISVRSKFYAVFWIPPTLQTGAPTSMPTLYQNLQTGLLRNYPGHGIGNTNTQYFQIVGGVTTYVSNLPGVGLLDGLAGVYVDNAPYPASGCADSVTPGNCITKAQMETELQRVIALNGWVGGTNKLFVVYTSSGEGSCMGPGGSCSYVDWCAYHSFISTSQPVVYANMPYGDQPICNNHGQPNPNGDAAADSVANAASHEISEMITDPLFDGWYTGAYENGDLCAYIFGANTYDAGNANQQWNGIFYEFQEEWSNHAGGCVQLGP